MAIYLDVHKCTQRSAPFRARLAVCVLCALLLLCACVARYKLRLNLDCDYQKMEVVK